jgi:hypothetical protein
MSWIQSQEDGDAYAEAQALGADHVVLSSKRMVTKFLEKKQEIGITDVFSFFCHFVLLIPRNL